MSVVRSTAAAVGEVLDAALARDPDHEALVASDGRCSYAELDAAADAAAGALHALGARAGDVVAVSLPNATAVVVTFHAVMRLGAIWLGVNRNLAPAEKHYILDDADAGLFLADLDVAQPMADAPGAGRTRIVTVAPAAGDWSDALAASSGAYPRAAPDPSDTAGIAYTSGTTGRPKGVVHTHQNLLLPGTALVADRGYGPDLRRGDCAALTILNLQVTSTLLTAQAGGTQVVMDRVDPAGIAAWIKAERINSWFGVPTMLHGLAGAVDVAPGDLASLEDVWTGGTYAPESILDAFTGRFGVRVHATYGLTEVPTVATIEPRDEAHITGSSGRALPHLVVEIRAKDGAIVPTGEPGEITIRGNDTGPWASTYQPMVGYRGAEAATASTLRDGVLHTGDIGTMDGAGHLFVRDRGQSVILRGGSNVYPAEVERVLVTHPDVIGAAVVGYPDERLGQRVAAAVELAPGTDQDEVGLRTLCLDQLARYKVPDRWTFGPLPRNAMGKVVRPDVERWFLE